MSIRTALIDADVIAYQLAFKNTRTVSWGDGATTTSTDPEKAAVEAVDYVHQLADTVKADAVRLAFSGPSDQNWRLKVLPTYKAHRAKTEKPKLHRPVVDALKASFEFTEVPFLEGDDVLGILATHKRMVPGTKVVVSIDKDLGTVPGRLYDPKRNVKRIVSPMDAAYFHMLQTLMGDPVDGYTGIPGVGPKTAEARLDGVPRTYACLWPAVLDMYLERGLTPDDALTQARVARICHASDFDFKRKEVKLWHPAS